MRKILIAFDGTSYSGAALEFANRLNEKNPVLIVGAFMPQTTISHLWSYAGGSPENDFIPLVEHESAEIIKKNIRHFEYYCIDHGIEHRLHKDYFDFAIPELKNETRFADLLIISSNSFYAGVGEEPNAYLKEVLHGIECPVLLVPDNVEFPQRNILAYDGSEASVFAIKQFSYLLPELAGNPTTLVHANEEISEPMPDELNIQEMAARHFPDLTLLHFGPDPKKFFSTWLTENKASILVSGAFGRSGLSRLLHRSFVTSVIKEHNCPIFIAHK